MTTLLEIVLRSSLILFLGLALLPLLGRRSAALRHWVLFTCVISAGAMPLLSWLLPSWRTVDVTTLVPAPLVARVGPLADVVTGVPRPLAAVPDATMAVEAFSWTESLLPIWVIGALLWLAMLCTGLTRLYRLDRSATPVTTGPWPEAAGPSADVRATDRPGFLLVWGHRHPSIIVPAAALLWSRDRIESVMHHELAHIRRADWLLQIAAEAVRALYWFNPLVWIACARLRAECEIACDDEVITSGASGADYAAHVVAIARELNTRHWLPAPTIVRRSTLERRVRAMLDKTRNRNPVSRTLRGAAVAFMLTATVALTAVAAQSFVSLSGSIVDPSNGVLPGVKLILVNEQTRAKYEIQSDRNGKYEFVGLPAGRYRMEAALPGFARFTSVVEVTSHNLQQDFMLSLGMLQEQISISSGPPRDGSPNIVSVSPEVIRKVEERRQRATRQCQSLTTAEGAPVGGNIRVPVKLRDVKPVYPPTLYDTPGQVVLNARVSTDGSVDSIEVRSATHREFADATIAAVSQWVFDATVLNCEPVPVQMQVTANYTVRQ